MHKYFRKVVTMADNSKVSYCTVSGQSFPKWLTSSWCKNTSKRRGQLTYNSKASYYTVPEQSFPKLLTST